MYNKQMIKAITAPSDGKKSLQGECLPLSLPKKKSKNGRLQWFHYKFCLFVCFDFFFFVFFFLFFCFSFTRLIAS